MTKIKTDFLWLCVQAEKKRLGYSHAVLAQKLVVQFRTVFTLRAACGSALRPSWSTSAGFEFDIYASAGEYGDISSSGQTKALLGGNQTFTISPNAGYTVDAIMLNIVNNRTWHLSIISISNGAGMIARRVPCRV